MAKSITEPDKATQVKEVQQELANLQKALSDLVDALIEEGKPGPKEIKKLQAFKKHAQSLEANLPKLEKSEPTKNKKVKNPKASLE